MQRRDFLKASAAAAAGGATLGTLGVGSRVAPATSPDESPARALARRLPRWRGFNLLEKFQVGQNAPFAESDFRWMTDWGFDFARLPMDYRCWTDAKDPEKLREKTLAEIDRAVEFGRRYGVHVSLNLHRAPGYTVASPPEKLDLWTSEEAQRLFDFQWSQFARRYRGIPSKHVSFNLVNEPAKVSQEAYAKVVRRVVGAIRAVDPDRLVIADGLSWGRDPVVSLADLGIAQATRGYDPMQVSHYKASWAGGERYARPTWPLRQGQGQGRKTIDRDWLRVDRIEPWKKLEASGVGVMVGEWGAFNKTPHEVVLAWARDLLELWKEAGWGWALWNLRGGFGIVDSQRDDVAYDDIDGHRLDRKLLDLLRKY
jgi:endoglucanase